ncbi:DEAD/DEAH box helicase [Mucilaginibacter paludis]|uniref:DEAD/DEAH box helicase domain protein n=1 Tax=Mucilaginibacter paludis DSM 18603 TaxID=714943 RepID=H1Y810_9SPHI|nr:DEAD/DEAH box helicase [Mucilaginibacter paludis]EHQ30496.1 DEAD/DEAH box helicase domain protein [Mucilaginibacter paludis DSM 18603]
MWSDKLKLNKQLVRSVTDAGYLTPKEIQAKSLSRIIGGQDMIGIGPEGCGKTTTYILGVLMRLKYGVEEAPRALILVPDKERVLAVTEQFELLNKNDTIRVVSLYAAPGIEAQMNALADGADIVVATPDRARAIYLKLGLNLNKIIIFIVDDADAIVKQGLQLPVNELANSITKCQHLVFTEVLHGKLEHMIDPFMNAPAIIEIDDLGEAKAEILDQVLYHVPNFRTKINLLNLLMQDEEVFTQTLVFVNTRLTAEKILNSFTHSLKKQAAILNPLFFESPGFENITDFKEQTDKRILIIANELQGFLDVSDVPFMIHLELPDEKETFIERIIKRQDEQETIAITFATDIELGTVKKIEHSIGHKIPVDELPENLVVANEEKETAKKKVTPKPDTEMRGEAFHEKKESNKKDYNFSAGTKAKMNKKKKHG